MKGTNMRNYKPATFQPTIRPDWGGVLSYISDEEKAEILTAIIKYPTVECNSAFWKETIKPDLDMQYEAFQQACEAKSRGVRNRWGKISITDVKDKNKTSIRYDIDTEREREEEKESEEENKGGVGGKNNKPTLEQVLEYAKKQNSIAGMGGFPCTNEQAEDFFNHYAAQGWIAGNGIPIHNWQHKLREWVKEKHKLTTPKLRMSLKEIKEMENHIKLQKMLDGEL